MKKQVIYVLIHGLTPVTMKATMAGYVYALIEQGVEAENIINLGYTARGKGLPQVASEVYDELNRQLERKLNCLIEDTDKYEIRVIAHSLGGLITRYLGQYGLPFTRVIMLGTPNSGVTWVDDIPGGRKLGRILFGPDIVESIESTQKFIQDLPNGVGKAKIVAITGTKQITWWNPLSWMCAVFLKGNHDGFVPAKAVRLQGALHRTAHVDHLEMVTNYSFIKKIVAGTTWEK